jgi:hypothetical protein
MYGNRPWRKFSTIMKVSDANMVCAIERDCLDGST